MSFYAKSLTLNYVMNVENKVTVLPWKLVEIQGIFIMEEKWSGETWQVSCPVHSACSLQSRHKAICRIDVFSAEKRENQKAFVAHV